MLSCCGFEVDACLEKSDGWLVKFDACLVNSGLLPFSLAWFGVLGLGLMIYVYGLLFRFWGLDLMVYGLS